MPHSSKDGVTWLPLCFWRATRPSHGESVDDNFTRGLQADLVKECHYILRGCGLQDSLQAIEAAKGIVSVLPF